MRADKLVMLGVGALGVYAVYRMLKTDGKALPTDSASSPGSLPTSLDARQVLSNPTALLLKAQTQYRMRLELQGGLPPFAETSSDSEVASALTQLGFRDVQVFRSAPSWWPQGAETAGPGAGTRFIVAQWGPTTVSVPRPKAVALIWQAKAPS